MNQRPFSPVTGEPFKVENYYFQIIFNRLIAKKPLPKGKANYTFTVYKANQKCQSTRPLALQIAQAYEYPLQGLRVNFVAINYNPSKNLTFEVRIVQNLQKKDKEIGEYVLDANRFIDQFVMSQNGAFTLRIDFNDDCAADIELYVQRSRYGVERIIRQLKNPKPLGQKDSRPPAHQTVTARKKLQIQPLQKDQQIHHHQKFTKFSPRREANEVFSKKDVFSKTEQAPLIKTEVGQQPIVQPAPEKKKVPKTQFVPKKQWMIPEAEKIIAKKKNSKKESIKSEPINQQKSTTSFDTKKKSSAVKKVQQKTEDNALSLLKPKYLIVFVILSLIAFISYRFVSSTPHTPEDIINVQKIGKSKKQPVKAKKIKK